jgi:hypothetical protein
VAELDPDRLKEIEAEERARAEIRAKLEAEKPKPKPIPQQSPYKGVGCGFVIWGVVLAILSSLLGFLFPPLLIMAVVFVGMIAIGILMWLVFG